jgi:hypothetical protein
MRKLILAASVCASVVAFLPTAAHADPPSVAGATCGFTTSSDPTAEGQQTGEVDSHFVTTDRPATDGSETPNPAEVPSHGHIDCIFKAGLGNNTYGSGGVIATRSSDEMPTFVSLQQQVAFADPGEGVPIYICTVWTATDGIGDTGVWYADDTSGGLVKSTDPGASSATCAEATSQSTPPVDLSAICGLVATLPPPLNTTLAAVLGC